MTVVPEYLVCSCRILWLLRANEPYVRLLYKDLQNSGNLQVPPSRAVRLGVTKTYLEIPASLAVLVKSGSRPQFTNIHFGLTNLLRLARANSFPADRDYIELLQ